MKYEVIRSEQKEWIYSYDLPIGNLAYILSPGCPGDGHLILRLPGNPGKIFDITDPSWTWKEYETDGGHLKVIPFKVGEEVILRQT